MNARMVSAAGPLGVTLALWLSAGWCSVARGQVAAGDLSLPDYDARRMDAQIMTAVQQDLADRASPARNHAVAQLSAQVPALRIDLDDVLGTPQYIGSPARLLTDKSTDRPIDARRIVAAFVREHRDLVGITPEELAVAAMIRDFHTQHNGVRHFTYQQQIDGIDIFHARLRTSVTADGQIVNLSSLMLPRPAGGFVVPDGRISALDALSFAAANVGITLTQPLQLKTPPHGPQQRQVFGRTADFADDVEVWRVYFPLTAKQIRPAWMVVAPQIGIGNVYETIVDAVDGRVLHRWNRLHFDSTEPITFNVYTSDSPAPGSPGTDTPNGFQFPLVPRTLVTVNPADVIAYSPNGWIDDGVNETLGNNVDAHTDLDANNQPDLPRPMGSPYRVFDFPLDLALAPSAYRPAAVTQLFYLANLFHDKLYSLGFDEAAHNFQFMNFSGMGVDGDRIQADAQDGGGVNNANFNTMGADGSNARVQMYVWTGPNPDRDGDLDADIVFHELGHGVSIRLHEGTLTNPQGGGMGEGWSDLFGIVLNAEPDDDVNAVYPMVAYSTLGFLQASFVNNYYFGIRRFPYSTDLNKNPQTFADIDPAQQSYPPNIPRNTNIPNTANEVHNVGEIWCGTLLECRANLVTNHGFTGNDLLLQLVVDGMKLSPSNPNFLQARDAILQADMINNGGANQLPSLWPGFAKRGMGYSATSPAANTTSGIVEAFDAPTPQLQFTYPLGVPTVAAPNGSTPVTVQIGTLFGGSLVPGTVQLATSVNSATFVSVPMIESAPNVFVGNLPPASCQTKIRWYVSAEEATSGPMNNPSGGPAGAYLSVTATGLFSLLYDDFETEQGWVVGAAGDTATPSGLWVRVDPNGSTAQPEDDLSIDGTMCFVTGQHVPDTPANNDDVDGGTTTLISPTFTALGLGDQISYARWFYGGTGDSFVAQVSNNNGATWVTIETVTTTAPSWTLKIFPLASFVAPTDQMKLRFRAADAGTATTCEAAVDEVRVFVYECTLNGNCNGLGGVGLADYPLFGDCLTGPGAGSIGVLCGCADLDADLDVDLHDCGAFQNLFNGQ